MSESSHSTNAQVAPNQHRYYMVEGKTSGEDSQDSISTNGSIYSFITITDGDAEPTGSGTVVELTYREAKAATQSEAFGESQPSHAWLTLEQEFCEELAHHFRAMNSGLTVAQSETMFAEAESTSHAISRGLVNVARARWQLVDTGVISVPTRDAITAMIDVWTSKLPRSTA